MKAERSRSASGDRPHVVLVGAGTAHLALVFGKQMGRWLDGVSVTLVNARPTVLYTGMLPACVAGECSREDITVDLPALCVRAGVRFVEGWAETVDPHARTVTVRGRKVPLRYDALAMAPGARTAGLPADALGVRPLETFLDQIAVWEKEGRRRLAVVGGGASGAELSVALAVRGFQVALYEKSKEVLPEFAPRVARRFRRRLEAASVEVRTETTVATCHGTSLRLATGREEAFDGLVWATGAAAPDWLSLLPPAFARDRRGFLRIGSDLRVVGLNEVFATGDGTVMEGRVLPRNGVVAVHQAACLGMNLDRFFRGAPLASFRLERPTLWILNGGRGVAVAGFGPLAAEGRWARHWKERLDRRWLKKAERPAPRASSMLCEGCGGKVPAATLAQSLRPSFDDVGLWQSERGWTAGSIDELTSWTDDPYIFGEIATLHALSDVYAKGLEPKAVLVAATLPESSTRDLGRVLEELDGGIRQALEGTPATLATGHTGQGAKLALAVTVTAEVADPSTLWRHDQLRAGDVLVLTKPLGTGIALAARAQGACPWETWTIAEASMRTSNAKASVLARRAGVRAATDVTGFGLAVAAESMANASGRKLRWASSLPTFPGVDQLYETALRPSLFEENRRRAAELGAPATLPPVAYDPQTSGGLLVAVKREEASALGTIVASVE